MRQNGLQHTNIYQKKGSSIYMIFGTDLAIERREITNSGKNDGDDGKKAEG